MPPFSSAQALKSASAPPKPLPARSLSSPSWPSSWAANGTSDKDEGHEFLVHLRELPGLVEQVLPSSLKSKPSLKNTPNTTNFFFLGRHYMFPTSLEAALKLKEISLHQCPRLPCRRNETRPDCPHRLRTPRHRPLRQSPHLGKNDQQSHGNQSPGRSHPSLCLPETPPKSRPYRKRPDLSFLTALMNSPDPLFRRLPALRLSYRPMPRHRYRPAPQPGQVRNCRIINS